MAERRKRSYHGGAGKSRVRRRLIALSLGMLTFCGCAGASMHATNDQSQAQRVAESVQKLRGLDFVAKVPLVIKTRAQAQQMMAEEISRDHTDEQLRVGGVSGAMTGLYPPGMDLRGETLKLLRSQIAGFYDPRNKTMVLVRGTPLERMQESKGDELSPSDRMVFAHELTHSLQDQHFQIAAMLRRVKDNDDQSLALKALAEGDATLASLDYVCGGLDDRRLTLFTSRLALLPQQLPSGVAGLPIGLTFPVFFQYADGTRFVMEAWRRGGWMAVDALYRDPPVSTQQILQPALYFDRRSLPWHIELAGYREAFKDWRQVDDDTYGELLLRMILKRNLPARDAALETIPRWAGDRMVTLEKGDKLTLLWIVAFRDTNSAAKFAKSYRSILARLPGEQNPYYVDARGNAVLIVIGTGASRFPRLAPVIWKASTITRTQLPENTPPAMQSTGSAGGGAVAVH